MERMFSEQDYAYMRLALEESKNALLSGDVPVGAVLVDHETGKVLAKGRNTREALGAVLGHAELNAITDGCSILGGWRLSGCTLYVTLEPCSMCAGAILHARIPRVVYGASDPVAGAMGSVWSLHSHPVQSKHTRVEYGCLEEECREVLQDFFKNRRKSGDDGCNGEGDKTKV